jgi:hypothetical protein
VFFIRFFGMQGLEGIGGGIGREIVVNSSDISVFGGCKMLNCGHFL